MIDAHVHSSHSDGENNTEFIVSSLVNFDCRLLGFSDHWGAEPYGTRSIGDLQGYLAELALLRQKVAPQVRVLSGVELPARRALLPIAAVDWDALAKLDYLLLEDLEYLGDGEKIHAVVKGLDGLPCAKGLAHCNLFLLAERLGLNEDGLACWMARAGLFWEINAGVQHAWFDDMIDFERKRPERVVALFDALNRHGVPVTAGSDAHTLCDYPLGRLKAANEIIAKHLLVKHF